MTTTITVVAATFVVLTVRALKWSDCTIGQHPFAVLLRTANVEEEKVIGAIVTKSWIYAEMNPVNYNLTVKIEKKKYTAYAGVVDETSIDGVDVQKKDVVEIVSRYNTADSGFFILLLARVHTPFQFNNVVAPIAVVDYGAFPMVGHVRCSLIKWDFINRTNLVKMQELKTSVWSKSYCHDLLKDADPAFAVCSKAQANSPICEVYGSAAVVCKDILVAFFDESFVSSGNCHWYTEKYYLYLGHFNSWLGAYLCQCQDVVSTARVHLDVLASGRDRCRVDVPAVLLLLLLLLSHCMPVSHQ